MTLKIAIIGSCPSSRMLAPYGDSDWQTWSCSPDNVKTIPPVDAWFELHADIGKGHLPGWEKPYCEWLNNGSFDLYAQDQSVFSRAIPFPAQRLINKFSPYFFTSTPAWMMALAIDMGAKKIGLFGLDMATKDEYLHQRPALQHFIWFAMRKGITIEVPHESDLMAPPALYGYSQSTNMGRKLEVRREELKGRISSLEMQRRKIDHEMAHLNGALDGNDYFETVWTGSDIAGNEIREATESNLTVVKG